MMNVDSTLILVEKICFRVFATYCQHAEIHVKIFAMSNLPKPCLEAICVKEKILPGARIATL